MPFTPPKKRRREPPTKLVAMQCWLFSFLFALAAVLLAGAFADAYVARQERGRKFYELWRHNQGFYEALGYHPPFGEGVTMPMAFTLVLAGGSALLACAFAVLARRK